LNLSARLSNQKLRNMINKLKTLISDIKELQNISQKIPRNCLQRSSLNKFCCLNEHAYKQRLRSRIWSVDSSKISVLSCNRKVNVNYLENRHFYLFLLSENHPKLKEIKSRIFFEKLKNKRTNRQENHYFLVKNNQISHPIYALFGKKRIII